MRFDTNDIIIPSRGGRKGFEMDECSSIDLDTLVDFLIVESLFKHKQI